MMNFFISRPKPPQLFVLMRVLGAEKAPHVSPVTQGISSVFVIMSF